MPRRPQTPDAAAVPTTAVGQWVDRLLQGFENRRTALPGDVTEERVRAFYAEHLEAELPALREAARQSGEALAPAAAQALVQESETLARRVVLPGYVRLAARYTRRERNDFYRLSEGLHGLERAGLALAGMLLGLLVVWAPFIPLWSKEWVAVFVVGGLLYPELRRWLAARAYERDVNALVHSADREASRLALGHLLSAPAVDEPSVSLPSRHPNRST